MKFILTRASKKSLYKEPGLDLQRSLTLRVFFYLLSLIVSVYFLLHLMLGSQVLSNQVMLHYYFDFKNHSSYLSKDAPLNKKQTVFHTKASDYRIFFINSAGELKKEIKIPQTKGYISYPENGSFILWYPRLGSKIKFYNNQGEHLWNLNESRYLKIFSDARYIAAFAGDQSHVEFLRPDMSSVIRVEGFLLHSYDVHSKILKKNSKDTTYQACLGFFEWRCVSS